MRGGGGIFEAVHFLILVIKSLRLPDILLVIFWSVLLGLLAWALIRWLRARCQ